MNKIFEVRKGFEFFFKCGIFKPGGYLDSVGQNSKVKIRIICKTKTFIINSRVLRCFSSTQLSNGCKEEEAGWQHYSVDKCACCHT